MVDTEHRQKYFNFRDKTGKREYLPQYKIDQLGREARKLEKQWLKEKERAEKKRNARATETRRKNHATGVKGISLNYAYSRNRTGNNHYYKYLSFIVQVSRNKQIYSRRFNIGRLGYKKAWTQAVQYLCEVKEIEDCEPLLKRLPERNLERGKGSLKKRGHIK